MVPISSGSLTSSFLCESINLITAKMAEKTILTVLKLIIILAKVINCAYSHSFVGNQILNYPSNRDNTQTQPRVRNEQELLSSRTTEERIVSFGYPVEIHDVITADGYILTMQRIPPTKNPANRKKPILFQHGGLGDSYSWVFNYPGKNIALRLADEGYDIWFANARGTYYSRKHTKFSDQERRFFEFSMHEVAKYDIPAKIDYILSLTGEEKLLFVGLSLGTPLLHMTLSIHPEYNQKLSLIVSIVPTVYLSKTFPFIMWAANFWGPIPKILLDVICKHGEFPGTWMTNIMKISSHLSFMNCELPILNKLCEKFAYIMFGQPLHPDTLKLIPSAIDHAFSPISTKYADHFIQIIKSGRFQQYDYGEVRNTQFYGTARPPLYLLNSTTAPTAVYYTENDVIVDSEDVARTVSELPNVVLFHRIKSKFWNHLDFLIGQDVNEVFTNDFIKFLEKY